MRFAVSLYFEKTSLIGSGTNISKSIRLAIEEAVSVEEALGKALIREWGKAGGHLVCYQATLIQEPEK